MNNEYMIALKGGFDNWAQRQEADKKQVMSQFMVWVKDLQEKGHYQDCMRPIGDKRRITQQNGQLTIDGPFPETKELISGVFLIKADTLKEATELAQMCPVLKNGGSVEVFALTDNRTE